jgi:hypothetical protein
VFGFPNNKFYIIHELDVLADYPCRTFAVLRRKGNNIAATTIQEMKNSIFIIR